MANIIEYEYTGMVTVCCNKCDICYEVPFEGCNDSLVEDLIEETLDDLGWNEGVCPICLTDD